MREQHKIEKSRSRSGRKSKPKECDTCRVQNDKGINEEFRSSHKNDAEDKFLSDKVQRYEDILNRNIENSIRWQASTQGVEH